MEACEGLLGAGKYISRALLRNSSLYKILQLRLWTPLPLSVSDRRKEVAEVLFRKDAVLLREVDSGLLKNIISVEVDDLESGDIPFFWVKGGGLFI